jgi:DNA-binding beta-propeller fold protein YncE
MFRAFTTATATLLMTTVMAVAQPIVFVPEGRFAVATHPSGDGISAIDLTTFMQTAFVPMGSVPNYAAFGSDPNIVYVSNSGNGMIGDVDLSNGIVRRNMVVGVAPEHIVGDAERAALYAVDANAGNVLALSLKDASNLRGFAIGGELHEIPTIGRDKDGSNDE